MDKIYHVKTKVDYDALMVELEKDGYKRVGGDPTHGNAWRYDKEAKEKGLNMNVNELIGKYKRSKYYSLNGVVRIEHVIKDLEQLRDIEHSHAIPLTAHEKITAELFNTYKRKNHDYGDSFTESLDEFGLVAGIVRVGDKVNRLKSLTKNEQQVNDESLRDTILDASNYLIMMAMWFDQEAKKQKTQDEIEEMLGI